MIAVWIICFNFVLIGGRDPWKSLFHIRIFSFVYFEHAIAQTFELPHNFARNVKAYLAKMKQNLNA